MLFSDPHISLADLKDVATITALLNSAYRGEASQSGWTTEAHLIAGDVRTNEEEVSLLMRPPDTVFLKYTENEIVGCVNLQKHGERIYLGMLSVKPQIQGGGIGKKLLHASEQFAIQNSCNSVYMTVISVRHELINWYKRHGYSDKGERKPFEEDEVSGRHQQKLEFAVLQKKLF
ncbi:MAG: GNAT family N-acetyltransferase [Sphingobacteriales bacterium]|jgi:ribosomal protein S18 acetylase RimI-like enzyme|nr:GNAT family N-acetyltransferase [Sphingobacteriales bacterium]